MVVVSLPMVVICSDLPVAALTRPVTRRPVALIAAAPSASNNTIPIAVRTAMARPSIPRTDDRGLLYLTVN
jgi:hypothetical protein